MPVTPLHYFPSLASFPLQMCNHFSHQNSIQKYSMIILSGFSRIRLAQFRMILNQIQLHFIIFILIHFDCVV